MSSLFKDGTIGGNINIVIVGLVLLDEDQVSISMAVSTVGVKHPQRTWVVSTKDLFSSLLVSKFHKINLYLRLLSLSVCTDFIPISLHFLSLFFFSKTNKYV